MAGIAYRLAMPEPHTHLFEVEMRIQGATGTVELGMPAWTPGSYLLREFARHVQELRVEGADGDAIPWRKRDKATWVVESPGGELRVRYRVYANELTVRTSHLDATHGYVNGASVFLFVRGREREPLEVEIDAPAGWRATTSLPRTGDLRFQARDYDELVDSPIEIGTHELLEWEQGGVPHRYAIWGRGNHDPDRLIADTRRIIAAAEAMFAGLPYSQYTFILHLFPEGRGGLEHRDSCSLQADRWAFEGEPYEDFLALVAHEFFHVWNAKRIRPAPLGPFDYTAENYTTNLWVVEGLTTYYTDLLIRRGGIITEERYLARLAESIGRFQAMPGRRHQTLADSSWDAWIRFYRPDEHSSNAQISYYHKGALVGLLLDLEIRRATGNERSLDDLMRALWERYGARDIGYPETGTGSVEALASEIAGSDLSEFFDRYIRGTEELEFDRYLAAAGVRVAPGDGGAPTAGGSPPGEPKRAPDGAVLEGRLGVRARDQGGRARVSHVVSGGPASRAGMNAGDELVALDGFRVGSVGELAKRVAGWKRDEPVALTLFRRDELLTLEVRLGSSPLAKPKLERVPGAGAAQAAVYEGWIGGAASLDPAPQAG